MEENKNHETDVKTWHNINSVLRKYPHARQQFVRSDVERAMIEFAELQQADADKQKLTDFYTWLNDYESLGFTEEGIKFYIAEYLKTIADGK